MKRIIFILLVLLVAVMPWAGSVALAGSSYMVNVVMAGSPYPIDWIRQFGTNSVDYAYGVAVDSSRNAFVSGHTGGTLPGQSTSGLNDAFVRKYDSAGAEQWTRQFGSANDDSACSVAVDSPGNVFVAGYTWGALPGQSSAGGNDAFIRKFNSAGVEQWTRQFGTSSVDYAYGVALDSSGNVFVAGYTWGALPGQSTSGAYDAFVRKYNSAGVEQWTRQFGTNTNDGAYSVAVDSSGNVFVSGYTGGTFPGQSPSGLDDAFMRKYDSAGVEQWTRQFGSANDDCAYSVAVDSSGNVFVAGYTGGTFPGQSSAGERDAFICKYDSAGLEQWTRQFGSDSKDLARGVAVDPSGNSFVVGETWGTLPGQSSSGLHDAFVRKYNSAGIEKWTFQFGTTEPDFAFGVATDDSGDIYVAGNTWGAFPGLSNTGNSDAFAIKFVPQLVPPSTPVVTDDGSYTSSTNELHASWSATDAESGIVEYQYAIGTLGSIYLVDWTSAGTGTQVTASGLTLSQGTTYYFAVKCQNGAGLWSAVGMSDGIRVDNTPPSTPAVIDDGAYTSSTTKLHASWSATDAGSGIIEYQYAIGTLPGAADVVNWTSAGTGIEVTATGLTLNDGTTYHFAVKCQNGAGLWSNVGNSDGIVPTTGPIPHLPDIPTNLTATAVPGQINLVWQDNSSIETGFKIEKKMATAGTYVYVQIATVGANITSYSDTNLTANTTYYYQVRAYGTGWDSAYSNEAQATTPPPPAPGKARTTGQTELKPIEYRAGQPAPGYSRANSSIFESWNYVRVENQGAADAFDVKATITKVPANVTIVDGMVAFGNIAKGTSAWSTDTFWIKTDMSKPSNPKLGIVWKIEYDDSAGVHHVIENVPQ